MNYTTKISATEHSIGSLRMTKDISSQLFRSLDPKCQRMEAIKITTNDHQSLQDAFTVTQQLQNKNLVYPLELFQLTEDTYFLITNLATMSLRELINWQRRTGKLFSIQFIVNIMLQIADGLQTLHNAGHFHGNLSAKNVLLYSADDHPTVKLNNYNGFPGN